MGVFTIGGCIISAASPASAQSDENLRRGSDEGHGLSNGGSSIAAGLILFGVIASIIGVVGYTMIMIAKDAIKRAQKSTPQANNNTTGSGPIRMMTIDFRQIQDYFRCEIRQEAESALNTFFGEPLNTCSRSADTCTRTCSNCGWVRQIAKPKSRSKHSWMDFNWFWVVGTGTFTIYSKLLKSRSLSVMTNGRHSSFAGNGGMMRLRHPRASS